MRGILAEVEDAKEAVHSHAREMSGGVRHGAPRTPQDLRQHAFIRMVLPGLSADPLTLVHENRTGREDEVGVHAVLTCNDHEAVLRSTLEGAGISSQAMQVAAPLLRSGRLQRKPTGP